MSDFFATGHVVDLILGFMVLEGVALLAYGARTGEGLAPVDLLIGLVPGALLLLALRGALVASWWGWIALFLMAALLAHLADLRRRWRNRPRSL